MKGTLAARIATVPRAWDVAKGAAAADRFAGPEAALVAGAAGSSPYLARLIEREGAWLRAALERSPEATLAQEIAGIADHPLRAVASTLRQLKRRAALLIALADLGGVWDLDAVTHALSDVADAALARAAEAALAAETVGPLGSLSAAQAGLIVLAMGKLGARELNYSSDIDLICLYDAARWEGSDIAAVRARLVEVVRRMVRVIGEITPEGYVFRTDLRLRPNPSTTSVCLSTDAAEAYYESVGRTWERAAFIKARVAVGDAPAGARFLKALEPFVWRRHLDFAAIEDAHDMRLRIRAHKGVGWRFEIAGHDIKLGLGGIREIEFFAQTQQLVRGGRDRALRDPTTRGALRALTAAGVLEEPTRDALDAALVAHRTLEHRLQMVEDAQTQTIPQAPGARARVAALGGWPDVASFEAEIAQRCQQVRSLCDRFFMPEAKGPRVESLDDLAALGFRRPDAAAALIGAWLGGRLAATRSERARRRFKRLMPLLLPRLAASASPDDAIAAFDRFLAGLPAGVQLFALFEANPSLLDLVTEVCAAAPRLARYLGRHAGVLDAVLDRSFFAPLAGAPALAASLAARLAAAHDHEGRLDAARRWAKELRFRIGVQVLRGVAPPAEAGPAFSAVAETCLAALYPVVVAEFSRRHGPPPGRGVAIVAMGKLGSREMTATSDLDLLVICSPGEVEQSDGPRPLPSPVYYARLTQMLIAALAAPTAEGALYAVDMRLRPSGRQGPVAVRLRAFLRYQREEAWTWEHLALTRARSLAGEPAVRADADAAIADIRRLPRDRAKVLADVRDMRARVAEAHRAARADPFALKHAEGGLMDIEFALQAGLLLSGLTGPRAPAEAAPALAAAGWLPAAAARALEQAHALMMALQQVERVALDTPFDPAAAGPGLSAIMARAAGAADIAATRALLRAAQAAAAAAVDAALAN